jgi:hypothetical protein
MQGYGHYVEDYDNGTDGQWHITTLRLTRLHTDRMPKKREWVLQRTLFPRRYSRH